MLEADGHALDPKVQIVVLPDRRVVTSAQCIDGVADSLVVRIAWVGRRPAEPLVRDKERRVHGDEIAQFVKVIDHDKLVLSPRLLVCH